MQCVCVRLLHDFLHRMGAAHPNSWGFSVCGDVAIRACVRGCVGACVGAFKISIRFCTMHTTHPDRKFIEIFRLRKHYSTCVRACVQDFDTTLYVACVLQIRRGNNGRFWVYGDVTVHVCVRVRFRHDYVHRMDAGYRGGC